MSITVHSRGTELYTNCIQYTSIFTQVTTVKKLKHVYRQIYKKKHLHANGDVFKIEISKKKKKNWHS